MGCKNNGYELKKNAKVFFYICFIFFYLLIENSKLPNILDFYAEYTVLGQVLSNCSDQHKASLKLEYGKCFEFSYFGAVLFSKAQV